MFDNISHKIQECFHEGWVADLLTEDGDLIESNSKALEGKIGSLEETIFDQLSRSVVSGQYAKIGSQKTIEQLEELQKLLDGRTDNTDSPEFQKFSNEVIQGRLNNFTKELVNQYKNFVAYFSTLTTNPLHDVIHFFRAPSKSYPFFEEGHYSRIHLFSIFISVQSIDHFFSDHPEVFRRLDSLSKTLNNWEEAPSPLLTSIIEKVNFLRYKWLFRERKEESSNDLNQRKAYLDEGKLTKYDDDSSFSSSNTQLKEWATYLETHYDERNSNWENTLLSNTQEIRDKALQELNFIEIHQLIRLYKDVIGSPKDLKSISKFLKSHSEENQIPYDKHSFEKARLYVLNNLFSLSVKESTWDEEKIQTLKQKIEVLQLKFDKYNYFPFKRYIEIKLGILEKKLDSNPDSDTIEHLIKETEYLKSEITKCKDRLDWAEKKYSQVFQLPFEESIINVEIPDLDGIFYASTFVLPTPVKREKEEFKNLERRFEKLQLNIQFMKRLVLEGLAEVEKLKESVKNQDFRSIEILGVFSAILAFVFSVPSLVKGLNPDKALLFYGVFGGITLLLFLVMKFRVNELKNWALWVAILAILVNLFFGMYVINLVEDNPIDLTKDNPQAQVY